MSEPITELDDTDVFQTDDDVEPSFPDTAQPDPLDEDDYDEED